jgi:A/G-specific adenine glycosylase
MNISDFRQQIFTFYWENKRSFPWRETTDPYAITVSEIMLQQTQTERVVPKYLAFLKCFPTWEALARGSVADVLVLWQGLGYNRRALALKRMAEAVVQNYGGVLPASRDELEAMPGIGPYTAGAILAFAFNQPVVCIETNIRRVFIHHFFSDAEKVSDKELMPLIEKSVDVKSPREWYHALMDYGAWLAKQMPNPNRRSAHYAKQSTFEGSNRQVRGAVIRALAGSKSLSRLQMYEKMEKPPEELDIILEQLQKEGFIKLEGEKISLA